MHSYAYNWPHKRTFLDMNSTVNFTFEDKNPKQLERISGICKRPTCLGCLSTMTLQFSTFLRNNRLELKYRVATILLKDARNKILKIIGKIIRHVLSSLRG